jgi:cell division protein FtsQ
VSADPQTSSRFFRPADAGRVRRNQRRVQFQRSVRLLINLFVLALLIALAAWGYGQTRSNERFAVTAIDIEGVTHTPPEALDEIVSRYRGMNLFTIDIEDVQKDLGEITWVQRAEVEKRLPGTLRVRVFEREPVALVRVGDQLWYVDLEGTAFAELSPAVGNDALPIISQAEGSELLRTVRFLESLRNGDPELFSRLSELWPIPPRGFAMWDRSLGAIVYANEENGAAKWRSLYAILEAEQRPPIQYADLRFSDRVIIKSIHDVAAAPARAAVESTEGVLHAQN